jgi:hypothetical protein
VVEKLRVERFEVVVLREAASRHVIFGEAVRERCVLLSAD